MFRLTPRKIGIGVAVYVTGVFAGAQLLGKDDENDDPSAKGCCAFERLAPTYDKDIASSEWMSGILKYRKRLLGNCSGKTLEVAAGTGRNLEYFPKTGCSLTLADISLNMLLEARKKASEQGLEIIDTANNSKALSDNDITSVHFCYADACALPFADDSFDTVVDTFGLCSMDDPITALSEMERVCKPGGSIRLLEHGRSGHGYSLLNGYLDKRADKHVKRWGCRWNKDIAGLIGTCTGLEEETSILHHFGTTYEVVLRKTP